MPTTDLPGHERRRSPTWARRCVPPRRDAPGVTVYNTDVLLGANAGTPVAHQPDGIHLSILGSQMMSNALIGRLRIDADALHLSGAARSVRIDDACVRRPGSDPGVSRGAGGS